MIYHAEVMLGDGSAHCPLRRASHRIEIIPIDLQAAPEVLEVDVVGVAASGGRKVVHKFGRWEGQPWRAGGRQEEAGDFRPARESLMRVSKKTKVSWSNPVTVQLEAVSGVLRFGKDFLVNMDVSRSPESHYWCFNVSLNGTTISSTAKFKTKHEAVGAAEHHAADLAAFWELFLDGKSRCSRCGRSAVHVRDDGHLVLHADPADGQACNSEEE
jgi:hypothetical protein